LNLLQIFKFFSFVNRNIFLNSKSDVVLGDLGLSESISVSTSNNSTGSGSIYYTPPEVMNGNDLKSKYPIDIWYGN